MPRWIFFSLCTLWLAACADAIAPTEGPTPYPSLRYLFENYGGGFYLSVFESPGELPADTAAAHGWWRGVGEPRPVLMLETFSQRPSCGRWIEIEMRRESSVIDLEVGRTRSHNGVCAGGPRTGAAVWSEFVDLPEGEHTLRIDVMGTVQEFRITVTEAAFELARVTPAFPMGRASIRAAIRPELSTFWRFPPRSFMLICEGAGCDDVEEGLVREVGAVPYVFPATGHPPFPTSVEPPPDQGRQVFQMAEDGDFARVSELLCRLAPEGSGTAAFALSWRNEDVFSWAC